MIRRAIGALVLVGWLPTALVAQAVVVEGACFALHYELAGAGEPDADDRRLAAEALAAIEPVWPAVCAAFGVQRDAPDERLHVHLYRDLDGYLRADRRLTGGRFGPNQAMSHWNTRSAHVAMQPPCNDAALRAAGLPLQTQAMLAWEACHLVRFELCPNFRLHPGWFQDGLAAVTARQVLRGRHPLDDEQPFFTQRWWRVRRLAEQDDLLHARLLLTDETRDLSMRDRYAQRVAFFEHAQDQRPAELRAFAGKLRSQRVGSDFQREVAASAVSALGGLDASFRRRAASVRPGWDERIRSLWCLGRDWQQRAFVENDALALRREPVSGGRFVARGEVLVHPGEQQQMNFVFAHTEAGHYALAIVAGHGFTLFDHRVDGNEWRVVASDAIDGVEVGVFVPFSLRGAGRQLELELAGESQQLTLPRALPDELVWGVGARAGGAGAGSGSFGVWRDVTVAAR
ncbi:MAG: hypothetical protein KAI24_09105 [Planctomycetes bacterium]|nr:hypothetical protein [Planctomycetota bacterium]